jgi:hypothetical protein
MTSTIDKIMLDFKMFNSLFGVRDRCKDVWSSMDEDARSTYKNYEEFEEVSMRFSMLLFLEGLVK